MVEPGSSRNQDNAIFRFTWFFAVSQFMGAAIVTLIAIWCIKFRGGFSWSGSPSLQFNWHPVLMSLAMVYFYGNGIILFRSLRHKRKRQLKIIHAANHVITMVFMIFGLIAVFSFHNNNDPPIANMYSLHSWVGMISVLLFWCQFVAGFFTYLWPGANLSLKMAYMPSHRFFGMTGFVFGLAAALMGLLEKAHFALANEYRDLGTEAVYINCVGVLILVFGTIVIHMATHEEYKRVSRPEDEELLSGPIN